MSTLLWLQRDLRIQYNPALYYAMQHSMQLKQALIAVYIHSPDEDAPWAAGAASRWWLHQSLQAFAAQLKALNIDLQFFTGNSVQLIPQLVQAYQANTIVWSERYEPQRRDCETKISTQLKQKNLQVKRFSNTLLSNPEQFLTQSKGTPYRLFTPFYKRLRKQLSEQFDNTFGAYHQALKQPQLEQAANRFALLNANIFSLSNNNIIPANMHLDQLNLLDKHPWSQKLHRYWTPGEAGASQRQEDFFHSALIDYTRARDIPSLDASTKLSAHLQFGEISVTQLLLSLKNYFDVAQIELSDAAQSLLRQLIWREFAQYIMRHFPHTSELSMDSRFGAEFWQQHPQHLKKWQQGQTGIAIVDAGMQQLWESGWMHNRLRMLCASLLTKNLAISWQQGARWFWDTLVDADLANNSLGWQWVAGCGVDAARYFRIFNPLLQQQRFDPQKHYIKRWLKQTHPCLIDLKQSREQALFRYRQIS